MKYQFLPAVLVLSIAASCGSTAPSASSPAATDLSSTEVEETPTTVAEPTTTQELTYDDFVFDASTDITAFPPAFYELSSCEPSPVNSGPDPDTEYEPSPFNDAADLVAAYDRVMVVEIAQPQTPRLATPVDLPPEYTEATGIDDGTLIAIPVTPVVAAVREVVVGPDVDQTVLFEIGCFDEGQLPSTIPGQQLLVFAVSSDPTLGPDLGVAIDMRLRDWMSVGANGTLQTRVGWFGGPPTAPFLEGMSLVEVVDQLNAAVVAADGSEESPSTDPGVGTFELSPSNPQPGETLEATFDPGNQRGGYFTLEQWSGSAWSEPAFLLESDANGRAPTWSSFGELDTADYGVDGPGPDGLVMPDVVDAGTWRLCTANALDDVCAQLTVEPSR